MRKGSSPWRVIGSLAVAIVAASIGSAWAQGRPPPRSAIPSGTGWFCFEDPLPAGGSTFMCDRPMPACARLRANRHAQGENVGTCAPSPVAYCFAYRDGMQRPPAQQHYCAQTMAQCNAMRVQMEGSGAIYSNITGCGEFR